MRPEIHISSLDGSRSTVAIWSPVQASVILLLAVLNVQPDLVYLANIGFVPCWLAGWVLTVRPDLVINDEEIVVTNAFRKNRFARQDVISAQGKERDWVRLVIRDRSWKYIVGSFQTGRAGYKKGKGTDPGALAADLNAFLAHEMTLDDLEAHWGHPKWSVERVELALRITIILTVLADALYGLRHLIGF